MAQNKYRYELANGKSLVLEGSEQPSDEEVESLAAEQGVQLKPANVPASSSAPSQMPSRLPLGVTNTAPKQPFGPSSPGYAQTESEVPQGEPDTWFGGFKKGLGDYGREITSGIKGGLESGAHPQTAGDFLNLVIPSEMPAIASGYLSKIAKNVAAPFSKKDPEMEAIMSRFHKTVDDTVAASKIGKKETPEIPIVNKVHTAADYASDNAFIRARGQEVSPEMRKLAGENVLDPVQDLGNRLKTTTQPRPNGPWDLNEDVSRTTSAVPKSTDNELFEIASRKQNMGRPQPETPVTSAPKPNPFSKENLDAIKASADEAAEKAASQLPKDLQGSKPRFNIGRESYTPKFESDLDKALFVVAQDIPSKRDADFLKFVMEQTGLDAKAARVLAHETRNKIKAHLVNAVEGGAVDIPTINAKRSAAMDAKNKGFQGQESTPDLMDEFQSQGTGPVKPGTPWMDDAGNQIGVTTDTGGSTGLQLNESQPNLNRIGESIASPMSPNDEISQLIKGAGLSEAPPMSVVDDIGVPQEPSRASRLLTDETGAVGSGGKPPNEPPISSGGPPEAPEPPRPPQHENDITPEIAALNKQNQIAMMASPSQKKSLWSEVRDANRALLTSYDFSAAGRQGKSLMLTKAYWTSFDDMFKSWGSQLAHDNVMQSIFEHPNFEKPINDAGEVGKSLADRAGLNIGGREEILNSNIAEKFIPGVKRSGRAYEAFLSKLRSDHFNTLVDDARKMGMNPDTDDNVLKSLGTFINNATGRGSLGKLEAIAPIMNEVFFAPHLMASRVRMYGMWLNPKTYGGANPVIRQQAIKSLISTVGFGMAVGELGRLAGAQVSNDPTSADFRKVKIGDSRIDPFSGFQQYAVGASRIISGKTTSSTEDKYSRHKSFDLTKPGFGMPSRASVTSQFVQNKLAPIPSLVWSWMEGKDWAGEPFEIKQALLDRTVPIVMQDLWDIYQSDPKSFPKGVFKENSTATKIGMAALPIIGEGLQTYGR